MAFRITYTDSKGRTTVREVGEPLSYGSKGFVSHCKLRSETRTFKFSGVTQAIDMDTGEVHTQAEFINLFSKD